MRQSCCYAPDILEMLQADLVIMLLFFNLLLDMLVFFFGANLLFFLRAEWGKAYSLASHHPSFPYASYEFIALHSTGRIHILVYF